MPKPYFDDGHGIVLYLGDARDVLPELPPNSVDAVITDPPYGVRESSTSHRTIGRAFAPMVGDESEEVGYAGLALALSVLKESRHIYAFGRWDLSRLKVGGTTELIWDKGNQNLGDLTSPWGMQHEYIQFGVYLPSRANQEQGRGRLSARRRKGTVLRYQRPNSQQVCWHPTEKPVLLLRELIESSSCIGETVLDPFAGVGSTLVAARLEARNAIGIEIEERYCEIAARRLSQQVLEFGSVRE